MMVDGSHSTIPPPPHQDVNNQQQTPQETKSPINTTAASSFPPADSSSVAPSTSVPPITATTAVSTSGRSRWMKLRTTVQLSSAITQVNKKPPLKREDSFLKRFSTRPIPDPNATEGSSRLAGDGMVKSPFLGVWRSVVNPDENILFYWLSLLTICLLYNAWTIIVRQIILIGDSNINFGSERAQPLITSLEEKFSFELYTELQQGWSTMWYCIDGFTDIVFTLDIAFQFRTGYLEQGLMVCESKKLACHYIKSKSFILDICAIIPLDLFQIQFGPMPILRFPRFLKLYRSFRLYYMVESRTIYPNLWRVVNLIHILLLLAHWFGCFYYLLSELEDFVGEWSYRKPLGDYALLSRKYLGSVYWSTLTLTTIGDLATPATNLQYMFTIVSYLIGVFIFATIVGQVGTVITNRNASRLEFERLLDGAKLYMRHHKVPRNMQRRVQRWYDYSWSRGRMQGGGDINSALGILPDKLKTELALHVNLKTLKKVSIFQECQPEFLHDLVLKMRAYIFTPGDLICRKGEVAREMFIIADGILEVISETGKVLTQMKAGDFFGEIGILNLDGFNRRTADVRSVGYSELFSLSREDILAAMKDYPEAQDILQTMGRKRLMEARLAANIGRATNNPNEGGVPLITQGQGLGETGESSKPRSTVSKLKEDVRSLKKLLRSRSTATGSNSDSGDTIEMKPLRACEEDILTAKSGNQSTTRRRNVSFKTLIQKIQFKREDSTTSVKSFTEKLTSFRAKTEKTYVESSSVSTDDSADSYTPLNKSLPLLQRVRMLGAQEKKSEMLTSVNFPNRAGLLKSPQKFKEHEDRQTRSPPKRENELIVKDEAEPPSPRSKTNPFSSMLTAVIPKGSTSPKSPKKSPKKEISLEGKKSPVTLKGRLPDTTTELPLLKKVLLRKVMDEKKLEETKNAPETENQNQQESSSDPANDKIDANDEFRNENGETSQETVSNRVYLEQFSRTLGFQMSEDVATTTKPQSRPRLNASSLTPSPSNETFDPPRSDEGQESAENDEIKAKSTSPPKGRLSRMMAVREDSDENSVMAEDPFVKSTECQTELIGPAFEPSTATKRNKNDSEVDAELRNYLNKMVTDLETVIKAYSLEQQQELLKENSILKQNQDNKDNFIKKLLSKLEETNPYETFEEVSSLGASSISVSEIKEDDVFSSKESHGSHQSDDEDRDLEDEEVMALQEKLKHQRKSWPTSVSIRRKLGATRQSCSLDDETQSPTISDQDELWRLEFPPPPPDMNDTPWLAISKPIYPTVPESLIEEVNPSEQELVKPEVNFPKKGANDWEVQMLVEQFEENVVMKSSRRHSSGEALTWDKVLRMRNTIRTKNHAPQLSGPRSGRKFSLVEEGTARAVGAMHNWGAAGSSSAITQSTSYTSLMNLDSHRNPAPGPIDKADSSRIRMKSSVPQNNGGPPTGRKSSLPILPQPSSICMARWLSMEEVKAGSDRNHDFSNQTSISSGCSQETVIEMDSKFTSVDNVHYPDLSALGTRSPSSPNVVTDRESHMSLDFSAASRLSDWPSSPCLPTIREDEQCGGPANTPSKSSPGRSVSHDYLPKKGTAPGVQQNHKTSSFSRGHSDSFHPFDRLYDTADQTEVKDTVILNMDLRSQYCQKVASDNPYYSNTKATNISTSKTAMTPLKDNSRSLSQNSVVIAIPEYEPVLSP